MSENENLEQEVLTSDTEEHAVAPEKEHTKKAKAPKAEKKKPNVFSRILKWLREMRSELKKVQWPTAKQTANNVLIVIVCVIVVGVCIWIFDSIAGGVVNALLNLFGKA